MSIAVCGVARSGSTLAWQILSGLLGYPAGRIHPTKTTEFKWNRYVVTIRHPFDIAASRYRVRLSRDQRGAGREGLEAEIYVMLEHFQGAAKVLGTMDSMVLQYEEFYLNYDLAIDAFENFLGVEVSAERRETVKEEFSFAANQRRAETMASFLEHDPVTGIHGDHIGATHPGTWKTELPDWGIDLVRTRCSELAKGWGYETN